jgi:hypothetical protein
MPALTLSPRSEIYIFSYRNVYQTKTEGEQSRSSVFSAWSVGVEEGDNGGQKMKK